MVACNDIIWLFCTIRGDILSKQMGEISICTNMLFIKMAFSKIKMHKNVIIAL